MRLAWATDIHLDALESAQALDELVDGLIQDDPDAVVLTGDLSVATAIETQLTELQARLDRPVLFVLGNHDFHHGAVSSVRGAIARLCAEQPMLAWLGDGRTRSLGGVAIVGVDGWADHRLGDVEGTRIELTDYRLISDFAGLDRPARIARAQALGDEEASKARRVLQSLPNAVDEVLFLTHLPPFREACWYQGFIPAEGSEWLPGFTCAALGEALLEHADAHPGRRVTVLCGHTHHEGRYEPRPNLQVVTGGTRFGHPLRAGTLELDGRVTVRLHPELHSVKLHLPDDRARLLFADGQALDVFELRSHPLWKTAMPLLNRLQTRSEHPIRAFTIDRRSGVIRAIFDRQPKVEALRIEGASLTALAPEIAAVLRSSAVLADLRKPAS